MLKKLGVALLLGIFLLAGCQSRQVALPESGAAPDLASMPYRIGVGDQLQILVWRNPDLSVSVPVRPDGFVSVPLIGDLKAADLTPKELTTAIETQMQSFVRTPQITVIVTNPVSSEFLHRVRVTGAIRSPSSLPYRKGMTVMDVILVAGGVTEFANSNDAQLYRNYSGEKQVYRVRLNDILVKGKLDTNFELFPGDIIAVPERLF
jgi:polysaccharide export outer membrane protein